MNKFSKLLLTIGALASGPAVHAATVIDFNGGSGTTPSHTQYGVTISAAFGLSYSQAPSGSTAILANGSPRPEFQAQFNYLTTFVSVDLGDYGSDSDGLFLEAYDVNYTLIGSATFLNPSSSSAMHTLTISNTPGIFFAKFGARAPAGDGNSVYADNFTFEVTNAVPEPATWAMMIGGFGMVGGAMRSARRKQKVNVSYA